MIQGKIKIADEESKRFLIGFLLSLKRNRLCITRGKCIGTGIRHGEIHFRGFGSAEITVRAGVLHLVKGIAEHLVVGFLAVEEKINGLAYLFVIDLAVKVFVNHLRALFGCDIAEEISTQIPRNSR